MSDRPAIPLTLEEVARAADQRGLVVAPACMAGVMTNLALLARHAETLRGTTK
ncbi:hypothetical protein ACLIMP_06605 [Novosphingobium aerophilum]|uniref:hypothetical protein n=1 Tax=Novosphingobium TaxID=165696 RepID=UPI0010DC30C2|nr:MULTISPECIES: hypothetical protein [unclassified Novosphingobium]TCM36852.1 hypothetical protein EDF59_11386 [Novosphingobium sp. ST904]WRT93891.1 hypothetical protein U9J33_05085 [Novosphingobium sp. RL4]